MVKDYYYILGIKENASEDDVKKSYRKLSIKFHPDKNDGDPFFTERFKEIQEAYETLSKNQLREQYNKERSQKQQNSNISQHNFFPVIDFFKTDKSYFDSDGEVTFTWRTFNADKVVLKPFGEVDVIGQKTYKLKNVVDETVQFELTAINTVIDKQLTNTIKLKNKVFADIESKVREKLQREKLENEKKEQENPTKEDSEIDVLPKVDVKSNLYTALIIIGIITTAFIIYGNR